MGQMVVVKNTETFMRGENSVNFTGFSLFSLTKTYTTGGINMEKENVKPEEIAAKSYIISFTFNAEGNVTLCVVGERDHRGVTKVVNAFDGEDAAQLYEKLITKQ